MTTRMQGVWLEQGRFQLRHDLPRPEPQQAEDCLLRIQRSGVCQTDIELSRGYLDFTGIPGHEFVATVCAGPAAWLGKRVVADINLGCGHCPACRQQDHKHCPQRQVVGIRQHPGAFADYLLLPARQLYAIPDTLHDERAVFAEPLAAAIQLLHQVQAFSDTAPRLLVGAGKLGFLIASVFAAANIPLDIAIRSPRPWHEALRQQGHRLQSPACLTAAHYGLVIESSASDSGLALAQHCLRPTGLLALKSARSGSQGLDLQRLVVNEWLCLGSRCGPMDTALQWLAEEHIDPLPLLQACYPLNNAEHALHCAAQQGAGKIHLIHSSSCP